MVPPCSDRISRVPPYSWLDKTLPIRDYHPLRYHFPEISSYPLPNTGLVRVRSPLLTESRLISFPPATEMFHFTGFASTSYVFRCRYLKRGGFPHSEIHGSKFIDNSPWLIAACRVLHRLLVPRHSPNALFILNQVLETKDLINKFENLKTKS